MVSDNVIVAERYRGASSSMNVRWTGFAALSCPGSAGLAFSRALEQAETDAHEQHPEAWVIEDRRISFSVQADTSRPVLDGTKRLLDALVLEAVAGEVLVEVH